MLINNSYKRENIFEELTEHYESLENLTEKLNFIEDLKIALKNSCLLKSF